MDEFKVVFAERSRSDLRTITFRVARLSGATRGERLGNQLIDKALTLKTFPERGRVVPEFADPEIREIIFKSYRIVYRVRAGHVEVIRFWHAARGTPEIDSDEFSSPGT